MRILLIRHGDPDYINDTLTEKGRREAALLAKRAVSMNMGECYKSPLGRAKDTATPCLEVTGKTAEILDWLQEFPAQVDLNKNPELEKAYPDAFKANVKMPPAGHFGDAEKEIGRVCVQLASPDFKYMNGETITLEGGMGQRP